MRESNLLFVFHLLLKSPRSYKINFYKLFLFYVEFISIINIPKTLTFRFLGLKCPICVLLFHFQLHSNSRFFLCSCMWSNPKFVLCARSNFMRQNMTCQIMKTRIYPWQRFSRTLVFSFGLVLKMILIQDFGF